MKLTQEQKRVRIAEACGWVKTISPLQAKVDNIPRHWKKPQGTIVPTLPDYFNDLNACHEMENYLGENVVKYRNMLADFLGDDAKLGWAIHAKPGLRAECFSLTLNLWKSEE